MEINPASTKRAYLEFCKPPISNVVACKESKGHKKLRSGSAQRRLLTTAVSFDLNPVCLTASEVFSLSVTESCGIFKQKGSRIKSNLHISESLLMSTPACPWVPNLQSPPKKETPLEPEAYFGAPLILKRCPRSRATCYTELRSRLKAQPHDGCDL